MNPLLCGRAGSSRSVGRLSLSLRLPISAGKRHAKDRLSASLTHSRGSIWRQGSGRVIAVAAHTPLDSTRQETHWDVSTADLVALAERGFREPGNVYDVDGIYSQNDLAKRLRTSLRLGVCDDEAGLQLREDTFGKNRLPAQKGVSFLDLLIEAIQDVTLYALIASGIFSLATGALINDEGDLSGSLEGVAILASVAIVVLVSAINDYQKESQFQELNAAKEEVQVRVIRNGLQVQISAYDLLVGDLLVIEGGDILPADCILVSGTALKVDESHLTGESEEVVRDTSGSPLVLSGSKVNEGSAQAVVIAVGSNSQSGVISMLTECGSLPESEEGNSSNGMRKTTLLEEKLEGLAGDIGGFGLWAAIMTWLLMSFAFSWDTFVANGSSWSWGYLRVYTDFLISGITVLVVAVPEGLPLAVTLSLAFSVKKMLQENNLVRQLDACETMGCATTILTDKTGTLTQNRMTAVCLWASGSRWQLTSDDGASPYSASGLEPAPVQVPALWGTEAGVELVGPQMRSILMQAIALNTTASYVSVSDSAEEGGWVGSQTEGALLDIVTMSGSSVQQIRDSFSSKCILPFSSARKTMASFVVPKSVNMTGTVQGRFFVKGAPDVMLQCCKHMLLSDGRQIPMPEALSFSDGAEGLRMMALAFKDGVLDNDSSTVCEDVMQDLVLIGVIGLHDPIRSEVPNAIKQCQRAGITVRMLTGDNASTGASIARQVGILDACDGPDAVMDAQVFRDMIYNSGGPNDENSFDKLWSNVRVLARCTPTHKFDIVKRLQAPRVQDGKAMSQKREVLAMTGDGTNDAPALRAADVGFAMNSGTSIAKAASDIVILDDSFSSLVSAVRWGRNVYISIMKFLQFQLTINIVAVGITVIGAAFLHRSPLGAVQMLWVNLIMDSLASLALATEMPTDALLELPPFSADAPLVTNKMLKHLSGQALYQMSVLLLILGGILGRDDQLETFTIVFNALVQMSLFNQLNCRRVGDESNVMDGLVQHRFFIYIMSAEFLLQWAIVQYGGSIFKTVPLDIQEWAACILFGAGTLVIRNLLVGVKDPVWVDDCQDSVM